jgi:tetratricopeptide (TPR) repeat protein
MEIGRRRLRSSLPAGLCLALAACATQPLNFTLEVPAAVNLKAKGVGTLAITTFEGPGELGRRVTDAVTARLVERQYLRIVEREQLLALDKELALGMTGVVDEKQAARAGKVLGADALLLGKVVPNPQHARLTISYRVIKTETGEILAARQVQVGLPEAAGRHRSRRDEPPKPEAMPRLIENAGRRLAADLAPHPVKVERVFETDGLFGDGGVKQGIELIKANRPEEAIAEWEAVRARDPRNSAAWYNLGVAYELLNRYDKAEQAYRAAERIDPKPLYVEAVGHVKEAAAAHHRLEEER